MITLWVIDIVHGDDLLPYSMTNQSRPAVPGRLRSHSLVQLCTTDSKNTQR